MHSSENVRARTVAGVGDEPPAIIRGVIKFYDAAKGYGFIVNVADGRDVFLPRKVMDQSGLYYLKPGTRVRAQSSAGPKGPVARDIELDE